MVNLSYFWITLKQTMIPMAISGQNGNNETLTGMSSSISLSIFDQNMNELEVAQTQMPIGLIIKRDPNMADYSFQYINITQFQLSSSFLSNALKITANNASIHIELKPINENLGYLLVLKLGNTPILNSTYSDFTSFKIFCPSKLFYFYFNLPLTHFYLFLY
jgi:hypothetical protein